MPKKTRKRPPKKMNRAKPLHGKVVANQQNLLEVHCRDKKTYLISVRRDYPLIPNDIISFRLSSSDKGDIATPLQITAPGQCQTYGRMCQDHTDRKVCFDQWKIPRLSLPPRTNIKENENIVCVDIIRGKDLHLKIAKVHHDSAINRIPETYARAIVRHGLNLNFSPRSHTETKAFNRSYRSAQVAQRQEECNLSHLPFVTIDSEDAKDFDDAVYCQATQTGYRLHVAIADVGHYVKPNSALDHEALERSTSIYFPGYVIPMLPPELSADLCSLKPKEPRLAMICQMDIDEQGHCQHYRFSQALISSHARLTYTQVNAWLANPEAEKLPSKIQKSLTQLFKLHNKLGQQDRSRLQIETLAESIELNSQNQPIRITTQMRGCAEKMIEEMMILANQSCAKFIAKHRAYQGLYRLHPEPKPEALTELIEVFEANFPDAKLRPRQDAIHICLKYLTQHPSQFWLLFVIRHLAQAYYSQDHKQHYGLGLQDYTHFTSPIRRYADLLNHRVIKQILKKQPSTYHKAQVAAIAEQVNKQSRNNDKAMYYVLDLMKLTLCQKYIGKKFTAQVDTVAPFGSYIYMADISLSTFMPKDAMPSFRYDYANSCFRRRKPNKTLAIGACLTVQVLSVDLDKQFVNVAYVEDE